MIRFEQLLVFRTQIRCGLNQRRLVQLTRFNTPSVPTHKNGRSKPPGGFSNHVVRLRDERSAHVWDSRRSTASGWSKCLAQSRAVLKYRKTKRLENALCVCQTRKWMAWISHQPLEALMLTLAPILKSCSVWLRNPLPTATIRGVALVSLCL